LFWTLFLAIRQDDKGKISLKLPHAFTGKLKYTILFFPRLLLQEFVQEFDTRTQKPDVQGGLNPTGRDKSE